MAMNITVAAFDVDETLTVRDCVVPFMRSVAGTRRIMNVMLSDLGSTIQSVRRRDRDFLKAKFVYGVFEGKNADEIEALGVQFASKIADGWLRSDVAARMRWHQEQGHVVILVSASLGAYWRKQYDRCHDNGWIAGRNPRASNPPLNTSACSARTTVTMIPRSPSAECTTSKS